MLRVVHPPKSDHSKLRQPLTEGERKLFELFDTGLDPEWEIYIQPHLNGLRPDFVLLNPTVGICVIEVKDWNLDAMNYYVDEHRSGGFELCAQNGNKSFKVDNPFTKIKRYKEAIYNIYCPRLRKKYGYAAVVGSVVFPFARRERLLSLQKPFLKSDTEKEKASEYWPIAGEAELSIEGLSLMLPILKKDRHNLMTPALADDLRGWLVEPDFASAQRRPLTLDKDQRALAESRTYSGYRRIKGAAGSGKSLVLAARAAKLADEGKRVFVVTFNMTLWHYLRDLVARAATSPGWSSRVTYAHFHEWCKQVCLEAGLEDAYAEIMQPVAKIMDLNLDPREEAKLLRPILPQIMNVELPELAHRAALSENTAKYDAVFVDEGQDYLPLWWNALRGICKPGGELLLVADTTQDIYGTARSWTDEAMRGAGFLGGRWAHLRIGYRLPSKALRRASEFARRFLPDETSDIPEPDQEALDLFPAHLQWVQCQDHEAARHCVNAILAVMRRTGTGTGKANADITFLANEIDFGKQVVLELATYGVNAAHTFERDKREQNRLKMAFFLGDSRVKATTFHSFKGWETPLMVMYIRRAVGPEAMAAIYAALTRLKRSPTGSHLTVVCSAPELAAYGATWADEH
ncbi:NERD domain-containing protein [Rhizobium leguminosarum]|uniref:nuclease-related domain-containing DEAD/DEAH box helicase n=1 Tax=Rhizobium leguminosarum TaxID=384 RepID=UPI003F95415B